MNTGVQAGEGTASSEEEEQREKEEEHKIHNGYALTPGTLCIYIYNLRNSIKESTCIAP